MALTSGSLCGRDRDVQAGRVPVLENLERRQLLSAAPQGVLQQGFKPVQWQGEEAYARPGQWLLKVGNVAGATEQQLQSINKLLGNVGKGLNAIKHLGQDGLVLLQAPEVLTHANLRGLLTKLAHFSYVEPDLAVWTNATTSDDPSFSSLWGLNNTGQTGGTPDADIDAPEAWDLARGDGSVVVGVIDSGVDYNHPDLKPNLWKNPGETAGNGIDDDGNGYKDDVYGWDFYNTDADPMDDNGHGTHVAGTIAAAGNNAIGVVGVNWNAKVMALKFLGADGTGSLSGAVGAINYATKMRTTYGVNVRVTNNSWSGGGYSSSLYDAINKSGQAGMLFVAAAGNGGSDGVGDDNDSSPSYPASYDLPNVIAVAATDHKDQLASFSNFGATSVDLAAPGVSILSTTRGGNYGHSSGTSMAAPHVAGAAALAWSYAPSAGYSTVRGAILNGVDAKTTLSNKVATGGRLNAYSALRGLSGAVTAPASPSALAAATVSSSQIDLTWTDNSTNEDGFFVYRSTDGISFTRIASLGAGTSKYSSTGLTASTTYQYQVSAYNAYGESAVSNTASATTAAQSSIPAGPSNLSGVAVSTTQIALSWSDNSSNESGFKIEQSANGKRWSQVATVGAGVTTYTSSNLKQNTIYYFRVRAYNSAGNSAYSNVASTKTAAAGASMALSASSNLFSDNKIEMAAGLDDDLVAMIL